MNVIRIFLVAFLILLVASFTSGDDSDKGFNPDKCTFNGIKLHGKIQFVTVFPDIKIQFVEAFPDIKVHFVGAFPDHCGEWQVVSSFPDFKVQIVDALPDLKVKVVDAFPGCK